MVLLKTLTGETVWGEHDYFRWWDSASLCSFYLKVLEIKIQSQGSESWSGLYEVSGHYPNNIPREYRYSTEDPDEPGIIVWDEVVEYTHDDILKDGDEMVRRRVKIT